MFPGEYCEIFKNTFSEKHLQTAISVLTFLKKYIVTIEEITFSIDPSHKLISIEYLIYPTATKMFSSESDSKPLKCTGS